ncbi:MAG TPA: hypothetical protein VK858_17800 [Longimicrobiales bacterium]|nr:hypothetical protein [Longimicrobiales bacterium]
MKKFALLALGILVAACGETPTETATLDAPPTAMNFVNAPTESGIVFRGGAEVGIFAIDPESGLGIIVGVSAQDFCSGPFDLDIVPVQVIDHGEARLGVIQNGEVNVFVFVAGGPICANVEATGTGMYVSTDNDYFAFDRNDVRKNANAFGWKVSGTLMDAGGAPVQLDYVHRVVYFPNEDFKEVVHIGLHY